MQVEVEIEEDFVGVPGRSPVLGLCGLCSNCDLELSVMGVDAAARRKLLQTFTRRCPEGRGHTYVEASIDDRHSEPLKDD